MNNKPNHNRKISPQGQRPPIRGNAPSSNRAIGNSPGGSPRGPMNARTPQSRQMPPRRQPPQKKNGLVRLVLIWASILAIILIVVFVIAYARGKAKDDIIPANATTETSSVIEDTATTEETFPVDYAVSDKDTTGFAASHDFTNGILIDYETNTVIASRKGDERIFPASMTKIMTLIVAVEAADDLDETFTMTAEITDPLYLANASVAGFSVGEKVTVRDLIYGLILPSGGDGALGLACHLAGSEEAFAEMMNAKAKELGLKNTHFTNCTGLHGEDHYSTCHEIALILEYAIENEFMREVLTTYKYTTEKTPEHPDGIELTSTVLSRMNGDESGTVFVQGGKTGYTTEAKNCLATFATYLTPGMSEDALKDKPTKFILVTAGSGEKFGPIFSAIDIYKGFSEESEPAVSVYESSSAPSEDKETDKNDDRETDKEDDDDGKVIIFTVADPT